MSHKYECVKSTVGAICQDKNGQILLVLRNNEPFKDHWALPGGHVDFGETPDNAMVREVKEETGMDVKEYKFFNYFNEFYPERNWHAVALIYFATVEGILAKQEEEVKELRFFPLKDALCLPLAFEHKKILDKVAAR